MWFIGLKISATILAGIYQRMIKNTQLDLKTRATDYSKHYFIIEKTERVCFAKRTHLLFQILSGKEIIKI